MGCSISEDWWDSAVRLRCGCACSAPIARPWVHWLTKYPLCRNISFRRPLSCVPRVLYRRSMVRWNRWLLLLKCHLAENWDKIGFFAIRNSVPHVSDLTDFIFYKCSKFKVYRQRPYRPFLECVHIYLNTFARSIRTYLEPLELCINVVVSSLNSMMRWVIAILAMFSEI